MNRQPVLWMLLCTLMCSVNAPAATYNVGPDQALTAICDVPWEALQPGDRVRIHWRPQPYHEKWVIGRRGTADAWIVVEGVPSATGALPVIDGRNATTRSSLNFWNENRGLIKIGGSNTPPDTTPAYIRLAHLELRSARPPYTFTGDSGPDSYVNNCAAVYVEKAEQLHLSHCTLHDCGNGLFAGHLVSNVTVEYCYFYNNGIEGRFYEHNNYTECDGILFQYNRFGPLRTGCDGNNLKDRSKGTVIRYNWIEGGNRQLDLVDSDYEAFYTDPAYRETWVYGNVLIEPDGDGNRQVCHYGGDSGNEAHYRKGTLYFYNNTVVSLRTDRTTLLRLSSNDETCDCRNTIIYTVHDGPGLAMLDAAGTLNSVRLYSRPGWVDCHGTLTGTVNDSQRLTGAAPGFVDLSAQQFRLAPGSPCRDTGVAWGAGDSTTLLTHEYAIHQASAARIDSATLDLGALGTAAGSLLLQWY